MTFKKSERGFRQDRKCKDSQPNISGFSSSPNGTAIWIDDQKRPKVSRQLRVVHLVTRLDIGGMQKVVFNLVRGMSSDLYQSTVLCIEEADVLGQQLRAHGHEVIELGKRRRRDLTLFFRIAALVRQKKIDVVHCHDEVSWFYGTLGARLAGVSRILMTMHGRRFDISTRHRWEQKCLAMLSSSIVSVSPYLRQQIIDEAGFKPRKVSLIPNGIPLPAWPIPREKRHQARRELKVPEESIVIGSIGRMAPVKNFDLLLEAAAEVYPALPSLRLVIIGDGPCRESLAQKASKLRLDSVVNLTGLRRDAVELLPGLDLYVCSSKYEGTSISILDAMAAGRAIIATSVGGNPGIIRHNETGVLVERGNKLAMAQAIIELSLNKTKRSYLGRQARCAVEANYHINSMLQRYSELYQR